MCVLPGIIILRVMVVYGWTWTENVLGEKKSRLVTPYKGHHSVCFGQLNHICQKKIREKYEKYEKYEKDTGVISLQLSNL